MDTSRALNLEKGNMLGGQHITITPPAINRGIRFNQVAPEATKPRASAASP